MAEFRASTSVSLKFTARTPDGEELPIGDDGLPIVDISIEPVGDTTGVFGEKLYFNVFISPNDTTYTLENSASDKGGAFFNEGSGTVEESTSVTFAGTNEANMSVRPDSITSHSWQGNDLGAVSFSGSTVTCSKKGVGVLNINYAKNYFGHSIVVPPIAGLDFLEVAVVAYVSS